MRIDASFLFSKKTGVICYLHFEDEVEAILVPRPRVGPLFPRIALMHEKHRAKLFRRRCLGLGIDGVSLHSYRYAWAERARVAGYPERFAQEALGHSSKAVHRAYARKAKVNLPSLESYEKRIRKAEVIRLPPLDAEPARRGEVAGVSWRTSKRGASIEQMNAAGRYEKTAAGPATRKFRSLA